MGKPASGRASAGHTGVGARSQVGQGASGTSMIPSQIPPAGHLPRQRGLGGLGTGGGKLTLNYPAPCTIF